MNVNDKLEVPSGFADYYSNHIKPQSAIFEQKRLVYLRSFYWRLPVFIAAVVGSVFVYFSYTHPVKNDDLQIYFFVLAAVGYWVIRPIQAYKKDIKTQVFPIVFKFFGDNVSYNPLPNFTAGSLKQFAIIPNFSSETTQDEIKAPYNGVSIHMVQSTLVVGSGKNRRRVFKGVFMLLSMNKKFSTKTIVRKDLGLLGNIFQSAAGLEAVHLEDPHFAEIFKVYSDDQVQARYILTTSFMENLLQLNEVFDGKSIEASFFDEELLLKIDSSKPWFEPDTIFKPCNFAHDAKMILQKMELVFKIIDILKLDSNTGV